MAINQIGRPETFQMAIQGGMLEALGINMYTTLGKCLVEFVANSYDSNSPSIELTIPFPEIESARTAIRDKKIADRKGAGNAEPDGVEPTSAIQGIPDISAFGDVIDESIFITIHDKGHGMSPNDIATKFLPVNRRRRQDAAGKETTLKSEGERRHVMGRKGLGKLAGFGTAQKVEIVTKRKGENFRTRFVLDATQLLSASNIAEMSIPATYEEGQDVNDHGTTVYLRCLKPDAVRSTSEKIERTLAEAFYGIDQQDFLIKLNGDPIKPPNVEYEFYYPNAASTQLAPDVLEIPNVGVLNLSYLVKFRKRGQHLIARQRGARIYCNHRLAAGPSLFNTGTGMHNFHAQDYMECIVVADELDRLGIDFVNTNRTQLREDNDVVDAVLTRVSVYMQQALAKHSIFRDTVAEQELVNDPQGQFMTRLIDRLPKKTKTTAGKLLKSFAVRFGTDSTEFRELAPLVLQSMNAGDVLIRLIELQSDPKTIAHIADELKDLAEIEKSDALKLFRGRLSGITALRTLIDKGEGLWKKRQIESELQDLLKNSPWLIHPEFSQFLTSDENAMRVVSKIAKVLEIDKYSKDTSGISKPENELERPDLVFIMGDGETSLHELVIVELKSPSLPLEIAHLNQLEGYMMKVEKYIKTEFSRDVQVKGILIGAMPGISEKLHTNQQQLQYRIEKDQATSLWEVIGLEALLKRTQLVHSDIVSNLKEELNEEPLEPVDKGVQPSVGAPEPAAAVG